MIIHLNSSCVYRSVVPVTMPPLTWTSLSSCVLCAEACPTASSLSSHRYVCVCTFMYVQQERYLPISTLSLLFLSFSLLFLSQQRHHSHTTGVYVYVCVCMTLPVSISRNDIYLSLLSLSLLYFYLSFSFFSTFPVQQLHHSHPTGVCVYV